MHEVHMNRRGIFQISRQQLMDNPEDVKAIIGQTIPVRSEMIFMSDAIEYQAYSPLFRPVEAGAITPTYDFIVTRDEDGIITRIEAVERS